MIPSAGAASFFLNKKGPFQVLKKSGADEGSRTLLSSLGSWRSTDELHPQSGIKAPGTNTYG